MSDYLQDKRTRPIFIHSMIDDMTSLTPNDMRVYMHIARRADNTEGAAWPSYQSIGDHCFASVSDNKATRKSFARAAIDNLIAAGLIEKHNRKDDDGGNMSNVYVLVDPMPIGTPRAYSAHPVLNKHQRYSNEGNPVKGEIPQRKRHTTPEHIVVANSAGLDAKQMRELVDAVLDVTGKRVVADGDDLFADRALAGAQECAAGLVSRGVTTPAAVVKLAEAFQQVYGFKNPPAYSQLVGAVSLVPQTNGAAPAEYQFEEWGDD